MTKAAAKELGHAGPGQRDPARPDQTAMTAAMPGHIWEAKLAEIPMRRRGEADEVASVALFLASDLASYVTGTVTEVTGGRHM